jgi:hypothetical protein
MANSLNPQPAASLMRNPLPVFLRSRYYRLTALLLSVALGSLSCPVRGQDVTGIFQEVFTGIPNSSVSDLTNSVSYPNGATSSNLLTGVFETPVDIADGYGQRLRAILVAPHTGSYTFFICSDDQSLLYLSPTEDPATKQLIAVEPQWNPSRNWSTTERRLNATAFFPAMNPGLPANRSDYTVGTINLTAGQRSYVEVLHKEGGGGDNLSVAWFRPNGTGGTVFEGPIPASHFRAFGVPFPLPPVISQQPATTTVVERQAAAFSVTASSLGPLNYQWQLGGVNIPGAQAATYEIPIVALNQNQQQYRCVVYNELGTNTTSVAVLTVLPDTVRPTIVRAVNEGPNRVLVSFSEPVDSVTGLNPANYALSSGVTISAANLFEGDARTVALTTSALVNGNSYTLTVNNVRDTANTPNTILANSQTTFTAAAFTPWNVGILAQQGTATAVSGGYNLTVTSAGISGTTDEFLFNYQQRTGDFDLGARVESLGNSDAWARGGLMARATLATNAVFAGIFGTPSISGVVFASRQNIGGPADASGTFPVNYPYTWVRLKRVGNLFTGYGSYDGTTWYVVGNATLSVPATLYVGMAASSRNPAASTTAAFRNVTEVAGGSISSVPSRLEPPGPSTRRSGLTITEIMYHPADRLDGLQTEFIELFNSQPFPEDVGGYWIDGDSNYTFPPGTVIPAGGYLVIARAPADLMTAYGLTGVLGPLDTDLPNSSGLVRLRHKNGQVLLTVEYRDTHPWPVAADGAGPSLVLRRPSYGESQPEAWDASTFKGGSPGRMDGVLPDALQNVVINEWLAHTDLPQVDFIELYNHSNTAVDVSGAYLSDRANQNKFQIPPGTVIPARGFRAFTESTLGFALSTTGEQIFFVSPDNLRVLDAVRFGGQANGISTGRHADGAPEFTELTTPTPGAANAAPLIRNVVINEIMFHPKLGDAGEYVELFNRGGASVDVSGWQLSDGVQFTIPEGKTIPGNGYLVIGRDAAALIARYPQLNSGNTLGNYSGRLSNSGERLVLTKREFTTITNQLNQPEEVAIQIPVDEVTYVDGGRWGRWADNDGSSLELRDPRSDNRRPSNWASSDETAKGQWVLIEHTGVLDHGRVGSGRTIDELQVMLLGAGECLIDEVEVFRQGGGNLVPNGAFGAGIGGWLAQGNHVASGWNNTAGFGGAGSLHLRASGGGDNGANRLKIKFPQSPSPGEIVTIRARARWLAGSTNLLLRLYGNYLEASGTLLAATTPGTPGQQNSVFTANVGPALWDVTHDPVLPAAGQPVVVTTRVFDPDGLSNLSLRYRLDPSATLATVAMVDNGTGGDAIAGDGIYSATIPGQPANTLVAFHVQATDGLAAVARFPDAAPTQEALVRFGETDPFGTFGTYRFWLTQANIDAWTNREKLSNQRLDMTFAIGRHRVVYNGGIRYRGSPFLRPGYSGPTGSLAAYVFRLPAGEPYIGFDEFNLDWLEQPGRDPTLQREKMSYWIAQEMGVPFSHQRYVYIFINGVRRGVVYTDSQEPTSPDYLSGWFDGADEGDLYKIDDWFEFNDAVNREFNVDATLQNFTTSGGEKKQARYRWNWEKRSNRGYNDDFTSLFQLVDAVNTADDDAYTQAVSSLVDVEQWLRVFFVRHMVADWDGYGYNRGKNMSTYQVPDGKFHMLLWDLDFSLGGGSQGPTANMFATGDPTMSRFYAHPPFTRLYLQIMKEAVEGPLLPGRIEPVMDHIHRAFQESFLSVQAPTPIKDWVAARRAYLQTVINSGEAAFAITSNGGANFSVTENLLLLTGTAPLDVRTITINGVAFPVKWLSVNTWQASIPLVGGANALTVTGLDRLQQPVGGATDTITVTFTGTPDQPQTRLAISELMYHPVVPGASYLELHNASTTTAFDMTGWRLNGLSFTFPAGTVIRPGEYLLVVENLTVFATTYGHGIPVAGVYGGTLSNNGETISLIQPGATPAQDVVIDQVRYSPQLPWPLLAAGQGSSLQIRDPSRDNNRVGNWLAGSPTTQTNAEEVLTFTSTWRYQQSGNAPAAGWTQPGFNDGGWPQGAGLLYVEGSPLPAPKSTPLTLGPTAYQFRTTFNSPFPGAANVQLALSLIIDDGAVVYLNGTEIQRLGLPGGAIDHTTFANRTVNDAVIEGPFLLSADALLPGENTLAVQVHQVNSASTDVVFGLALTLRETSAGPVSPGAPSFGALKLPEFPLVWINEVQPNNVTGATDRFGEREPWLELFNAGAVTVDLAGLYLSDNYSSLTKWAFPAGASIAPGEWKVIWLDGEPGETGAGEYHTSFRLGTNPSGGVALTRLVAGQAVVIDYLDYRNVPVDRAYGLFPDGAQYQGTGFHFPTPGAANNNSFPLASVVINEWMADNSKTITNPIDGAYSDWFELFNAGASTVDLSGYYLTDTLANPAKWQIPAGTTLAPGGFLVVWADNRVGHTGVNPLHAGFALSRSGEALGLFAPDLSVVDTLTFGPQITDLSQGRFTDGAPAPYLFLTTPTPGAPNIHNPPAMLPGSVERLPDGSTALEWAAEAGRTYRVLYKNTLTDPTWQSLGQITVAGTVGSVIDPTTPGTPTRFYLLELIP